MYSEKGFEDPPLLFCLYSFFNHNILIIAVDKNLKPYFSKKNPKYFTDYGTYHIILGVIIFFFLQTKLQYLNRDGW